MKERLRKEAGDTGRVERRKEGSKKRKRVEGWLRGTKERRINKCYVINIR